MQKRFKFLLFALIVIGIFFLTTQSSKDTLGLSNGVRETIVDFLSRIGFDVSDAWWNNSINFRRIGHVIEYGILGIAACILTKEVGWSIMICGFISIVDQIVKAYVPGRHFDAKDWAFDMVGYVCGSLVVFFVTKIFSNHRSR